MTRTEMAKLLDNRERGKEITEDEEKLAKESGLVVVFGASDDLMEFRGGINDEIGAYDGVIAYVDANGPLPDYENIDKEDEAEVRAYFKRKDGGRAKTIEAMWCPEEAYSWKFKTDIPHATFEVLQDGEPYCRGIVFELSEIR